jgi:hypothetical protein
MKQKVREVKQIIRNSVAVSIHPIQSTFNLRFLHVLFVTCNVCNTCSWVGGCALDSCGLGWVPLVGSCEHGGESSGSKETGEFRD